MRAINSPIFIIICIFAAALPWAVQPSTYWRDGAEFILAGAFLDISHPPGSPTYAQLLNPLSWLPIGPLPARINLGSALIVLCLMSQVAWMAARLGCSGLVSAFAAVTLLFLPGVMHQALTAEVYALSAVCILGMIQLYINFLHSLDRRELLKIAAIAGIGSGVHLIVPIAALILALLALCIFRGKIIKLFVPAIIIGAVGLAVWGYLPVRAMQSPPLNTGAPLNIERFLAHVTNARDRDLRPQSGLESFHLSGAQILQDVNRVAEHVGWPLLGIVLLGIILLVKNKPTFALPFTGVMLTVWFIFCGWDFAPFTILSAGLVIFAAYALDQISRINNRAVGQIAIVAITLTVSLSNRGGTFNLAAELSSYELPAETTLSGMRQLPSGASKLVEQSHFITVYIQSIENVRPDVTVRYQPALEWPKYFTPQYSPNGELYKNLDHYLNTLPSGQRISFEPSALTIPKLKGVARCEQNSGWYVTRPLPGLVDPSCGTDILSALPHSSVTSKELVADEQHARELTALNSAQMLANIGKSAEAIDLANTFCEQFSCSAKARLVARSLVSNGL